MERNEVYGIWENSFEGLSKYRMGKLYKIIGPFIAGFELIKLPHNNNYRPHFVVYSFWRRPEEEMDVIKCFQSPIILSGVQNKKNILFAIPFDSTMEKTLEAINESKRQSLFTLGDDVRFTDLKAAFLLYRRIKHYELTSPFQMIPFYDFLFNCSLYVGDDSGADSIIDVIKSDAFVFEFPGFKLPYTNLEVWLEDLQKRRLRKDEEIQFALNLLADKKLTKLKKSELIL